MNRLTLLFGFIFSFVCFFEADAQEVYEYNLIRPYYKIKSPTNSKNAGEINRTKDWFSPFGKKADLVSKKGYYPAEIPKIFYFDHYLGLTLYDHADYKNRSFASIRLNHALEAEQVYKFRMTGFFPFYEERITDRLKEFLQIYPRDPNPLNAYRLRNAQRDFRNIPIGIAFSVSSPESINQLKTNAEKQIIRADGYFEFNFEYTAKGGEKFLTIGNFFDQNEIPREILFDLDKYILVSKVSLSKKEINSLVPNGSFEKLQDAPTGLGQWWKLENWFSPHPNRLHNASDPSPDLWFRSNGVYPPLKGNGSGRVGYINMDTVQFNEGLSVRLSQPLEKGKRYGISYLVRALNEPRGDFLKFKPKKVQTDLDSLKVQIGLGRERPKQGYNQVLRAEKVFTISSRLSFVTPIRSGMITFKADKEYTFLTFGYFYELDVPVWARPGLGVLMDELYLFEIPDDPLLVYNEDPIEDNPVAIIDKKETNNPLPTPDLKPKENESVAPVDPLETPGNENKEDEQNNQNTEKPQEKPTTNDPQIANNTTDENENIDEVNPPEIAVAIRDSLNLEMPKYREVPQTTALPEIRQLKNLEENVKLRLKHEAEVKTPNCRLIVYDHQTEDGDIVTLKLNEQTLAEHLEIRRQPNVHIFEVVMDKGENFLYPIAENLGRIPPNTIKVDVVCGNQIQRFVLFSEPGNSEVLKVEVK